LKVRVLLSLLVASFAVSAESHPALLDAMAPEIVLDHFIAASRSQERAVRSATMEVEMSAAIPKLHKRGTMWALRRISELGRITYEKLRFEGDGTVKNQVIARYLTAEAEAQREQSPSLAVTPANYKFKYKSLIQVDGRDVHIFQVTPKQKRQGLFKGEVWIDAETFLRVQESGYMVKNPSIFLKRIEFVRKYDIRDGISVPRQILSTVSTRLVGKAELTIDFTKFAIDDTTRADAGVPGAQ
jgi:hypothetical protein